MEFMIKEVRAALSLHEHEGIDAWARKNYCIYFVHFFSLV